MDDPDTADRIVGGVEAGRALLLGNVPVPRRLTQPKRPGQALSRRSLRAKTSGTTRGRIGPQAAEFGRWRPGTDS